MFKFKVFNVILLLVLFIYLDVRAEEEGDECFLLNGGKGICLFLTQCKSAAELLEKGNFPTICDFKYTKALVCCPVEEPTEAPTTCLSKGTLGDQESPPKIPSTVGYKANEMCKLYSDYAYTKVEIPTLSITENNSKKSIKFLECPISTQPLIIGGVLAGRQEFPHMVHIGYGSESNITWDCGGSLISENFVLTAAHCLNSSRGEPKLVRGGITNQTDTKNLQIRNIIERIKYPDYDVVYHDIALLKVDRNFDLNTFLRPACLFTQPTFPVLHAIATGWGHKKYPGGQPSEELYKVVLEFFTTEQCNQTYRRQIMKPESKLAAGIDESTMVCAGSRDNIRDACYGDSGGPLQIIHKDTEEIKCMYEIVGVTSFGDSCAITRNRPGVYTRVSYYITWIEDIVWN